MSKRVLQRDFNIVSHLRCEISLGTKTVKDKSKYTRKEKHKNSKFY